MNKQRRILIVDDDQEILRMLSHIFELEGYSVVVAADGDSALAMVEKQRPDLAILDIMMPGQDGLQVLDIIRRNYDFPVIMLTGRCEVTTLRDAVGLGADDYVRKPFSVRELLARVRVKLRRAEQCPPHPKRK